MFAAQIGVAEEESGIVAQPIYQLRSELNRGMIQQHRVEHPGTGVAQREIPAVQAVQQEGPGSERLEASPVTHSASPFADCKWCLPNCTDIVRSVGILEALDQQHCEQTGSGRSEKSSAGEKIREHVPIDARSPRRQIPKRVLPRVGIRPIVADSI